MKRCMAGEIRKKGTDYAQLAVSRSYKKNRKSVILPRAAVFPPNNGRAAVGELRSVAIVSFVPTLL